MRPFGKYLLLDKIAAGGMAEVYRALYRTEGEFEKQLVIKRILPAMSRDEDFVARFRDEARVSVGLGHANIVQVFDFGNVDGDFFLAMELVEGQNLRTILTRCFDSRVPVPPPAALLICSEAAKALSYAHSRKDDKGRELEIVHRDISPTNILVSYEGDVKITDFGIAKAASRSSHTQDGSVRGKVRYMAPEQALSGDVDGRADVFSLGAVLWECLTGRMLFDADSDMVVLGKLVRGAELERPSQIAPGIDPDVERVVMKALSLDVKERYTAAELHRDLGRLLSKTNGYSSLDLATLMQSLFREEFHRKRELPAGDPFVTKSVEAGPTGQPAGDAFPTRPFPGTPAAKAPVTSKRRWPLIAGALAVLAVAAVAVPFAMDAVAPAGTPAVATATATPIAAASSTPEPTPTALAIATPATRKSPRNTPAPTAKGTAPAIAFGILKVNSEPDGGRIYVDGKDTGRETPAFNLKVAAGRRTIRIVKGGLEKTFTVDVPASGEIGAPKAILSAP